MPRQCSWQATALPCAMAYPVNPWHANNMSWQSMSFSMATHGTTALANPTASPTGHFGKACRGGVGMASPTARAMGTTIPRAVAAPWPISVCGPCRGKPWQDIKSLTAVPLLPSGCHGHCHGMPLESQTMCIRDIHC